MANMMTCWAKLAFHVHFFFISIATPNAIPKAPSSMPVALITGYTVLKSSAFNPPHIHPLRLLGLAIQITPEITLSIPIKDINSSAGMVYL
jgi:hypothetical protein